MFLLVNFINMAFKCCEDFPKNGIKNNLKKNPPKKIRNILDEKSKQRPFFGGKIFRFQISVRASDPTFDADF